MRAAAKATVKREADGSWRVSGEVSEKDTYTLEFETPAGAEYREHWAFVAPVRSPLPEVKATGWPRNGIDRFVLEKLEKAGLAPSPEADRHTLARRLYLDLVGLVPEPAEVDAFVADTSSRSSPPGRPSNGTGTRAGRSRPPR